MVENSFYPDGDNCVIKYMNTTISNHDSGRHRRVKTITTSTCARRNDVWKGPYKTRASRNDNHRDVRMHSIP